MSYSKTRAYTIPITPETDFCLSCVPGRCPKKYTVPTFVEGVLHIPFNPTRGACNTCQTETCPFSQNGNPCGISHTANGGSFFHWTPKYLVSLYEARDDIDRLNELLEPLGFGFTNVKQAPIKSVQVPCNRKDWKKVVSEVSPVVIEPVVVSNTTTSPQQATSNKGRNSSGPFRASTLQTKSTPAPLRNTEPSKVDDKPISNVQKSELEIKRLEKEREENSQKIIASKNDQKRLAEEISREEAKLQQELEKQIMEGVQKLRALGVSEERINNIVAQDNNLQSIETK